MNQNFKRNLHFKIKLNNFENKFMFENKFNEF